MNTLIESQINHYQFQISSYVERDIFYTFTEGQQDIVYKEMIPWNASKEINQVKHYDFIIQSADTISGWCTELKIKYESSTTRYIQNEGVILSAKKYDDLIQNAIEHNCRPVYINYFAGNGTMVIWFLDTCNKRYDPTYLRQGNASYNQKTKEAQPTYFLDVNEGCHYKIKYVRPLSTWHGRGKRALAIFYSEPGIQNIDMKKQRTL